MVRRFLIVAALLILAPALSSAYTSDYEPPPTDIQALVGAGRFQGNSLTFHEQSAADPTVIKETDLSEMPMLGFSALYSLAGQQSQIGIEAGGIFGWRSRNTTIYSTGQQTSIRIETSLWMLDVSMGLYASHVLANRVRLFAGAGPLMLFASYSGQRDETNALNETTSVDTSENAFGVGGYARAGIEFRLPDNSFMGVCVRGISTDLDFDNTVDTSGLKGVQGFLSYTRPF